MNKIAYYLGLVLLVFSCQRPTEKDSSVYEIQYTLVQNGISETDYPVGLTVMSPQEAVLVARVKNTYPHIQTKLYKTADGGKNWEKVFSTMDWNADKIEERDGVLYVSNTTNLTAKAHTSEILSSKDTGRTWRKVIGFDSKLLTIKAIEASGIAVYLSSDNEKTSKGQTVYRLLVNNQDNEGWKDAGIDKSAGPNSICLSEKSAMCSAGYPYRIFRISYKDLTKDTLVLKNLICPYQIIAGEDIIGIWNGKRADYFRVSGDSAVFISRIRFRGSLTDHIPDRIHQCGDIVYTSVLVPGAQPDARMFISTDRAKSWTQIKTECPLDKEYDRVWTPEGSSWFMAAYKDKMFSYCLGEKDGKRMDFIKTIQPKP